MSPRSTLSASDVVRLKSSFSKKRPPDVGKSITGRPNLPNQRNSISRPSEGLHHFPYSRYMRKLYTRTPAMRKKRIGLIFGMEDTFPWALINAINKKGGDQVEAMSVE